MYHIKMLNKRKASRSKEIFNKIDKYLNDLVESLKNQDFILLEWWKVNHGRRPILSRIVRDAFSLPCSTIASENAFSLGGRVVDPFRASLTPTMVEALMCTSDWFRGEGLQFYKEPTEDEVEFYTILEDVGSLGYGDFESQTQIPPPLILSQVPPQLHPTQHPPIPKSRGRTSRGRVRARGRRRV